MNTPNLDKDPPNQVEFKDSDETVFDRLVKLNMGSEMLGALIQHKYAMPLCKYSVKVALDHLLDEGKRVNKGDMREVERMLVVQAHTLNIMFNSLALKATDAGWVDHHEYLLRLALKAQAQSRATLESLANIKNPTHVSFVRQANIGHNQQVNNSVAPEPDSRAGETKNMQTQLLEEQHGERLVTRTKGKASIHNNAVEAVGALYGSKNTGR